MTRRVRNEKDPMNQAVLKPGQLIRTLNNLIELNRDGQKVFQEAAEKISAPQIKTFCLEQSLSRAHFIGELQPLVLSMGEEPENKGTVSGALHRGWMDLKSALGGGDRAILVVTESSEDRATQAYKKVLEEALPSDVRETIERQFQSVQQSHDKVKAMRNVQ
jgi:uncharacterized protein (TIGR02284 family)